MRSAHVLLLATLFALSIAWLATAEPENPPAAFSLCEDGPLRWHKGNMHTHSYWSDGGDFLESIALWYREHGYDFLVFTDHNVLADSERWLDIAKAKKGQASYDGLVAKFPDWIDRRETDGNLEVRLRTFREVADRFNEPGQFLLIQGKITVRRRSCTSIIPTTPMALRPKN
ncbi:MAG: hypothetical protein U0992_06845 [Planctomycetaceae bacterium]